MALIKKELAMLLTIFTYGSKKGSHTAGKTALMLVLLGFCFLTFGTMFYGISYALCIQLIPNGLDWLLFALSGLTALSVGVIGSVFQTSAILFNAKDNELLLSMPIPPSKILFVRMLTVYVTSLFSVAMAWIPVMLSYAAEVGVSFVPFLFQILLLFIISALVTVLSSFLGWLVALASRHARNKSLFAVVLSLVLISGYFVLYFRMKDIMDYIVTHMDSIAQSIRGWGWPMWKLGLAATGDTASFLLFTAIVAVLFGLLYFVLTKTLLTILTASDAAKKAVYHERKEKQTTADSALLRKELFRFLGNPTLLLNTSFGVFVMLAGTVAVLIKQDFIRETLTGYLKDSGFLPTTPVIVFAIVGFMTVMDMFTASSVSLEGKGIWIVQAMPVDESRVLLAKERFQIILNVIPAAILISVLGAVLGLDVLTIVLIIVLVASANWFSAAFGLMMNLKKPNLEWTNEAIPVKQGIPVMFTMLACWGMCGVVSVIGAFLSLFIDARPVLAGLAVIVGLCSWLTDRWIKNKGAKIFAHLS